MEDHGADAIRPEPSDYAGRELLSGDSPRAILLKLTDGDPLELRARCAARQRALAFLISAERATAKTLALTARAAVGYRGQPPLADWLAALVDRALRNCLVEDDTEQVEERHFEFAARAWGVTPAVAREACIVFNALPEAVRDAYFAIVLESKSINRYVAEGHGPPKLVEKRVKRALVALGTLSDPGGVDGASRGRYGS